MSKLKIYRLWRFETQPFVGDVNTENVIIHPVTIPHAKIIGSVLITAQLRDVQTLETGAIFHVRIL